MKRTTIFTLLILSLLTMFGLSAAHAQVGSAIVTATGAFTVTASDTVTLKAQIVSCGTGQLPLYNGVPVSLTPNQTPLAPFTASNTGSAQSVTFTVPGNDKIICGNQAYTTYAITWFDNGFPLAPTQNFRFVDATTQSLANLVPIGFIPPIIANSAGALCSNPQLPVFSGFDANYHIICTGAPLSGSIYNLILPQPTIQSAVNAAAAAKGTVWIPGGYTGTDTWTNPNFVRLVDGRPYLQNGIGPSNDYEARQQGVQCNGEDDTAAINAALAAPLSLAGFFNGTSFPSVPGSVKLPQGFCVIHSPIIMNSFGSLKGEANNTWIQAAEPFTCNADGCDMIQVMIPYGGPPNGGSSLQTFPGTGNRVVSDIGLNYSSATRAMTGIHVYNQTGRSSANPYPVSPATNNYQLPYVRLEGIQIFAMDSGFIIDDGNQVMIDRSQVDHVRVGILDHGNVFDLSVTNSQITNGSWTYTPTHSVTQALESSADVRWVCTDASSHCSTGTTSQSVIVSPQGFNATGFNVSSFDIDANILNAQGFGVHGSGFDFGGDGPTNSAQPTVFLGANVLLVQIDDTYIATNRADSNGIEIAAATSAPGSTSNQGIWLTNDQFQSYANGSTGYGVVVDVPTSSSFLKPNLYINNNQCFKLFGCFLANGPVTDSVINDNYGSFMGGNMIAFNYAGTSSFSGVTVADNTTPSSVPVIRDFAGGGYHVGWNFSPSQLTGTQTVSKLGCTISAGAIGNTCDNTIVIASSGGIAYPDTNYNIVCQGGGGTGLWTLGNQNTATTTQFVVPSVALSTTATGGGVVECILTHN